MGSESLPRANPLNFSPEPLFSDFSEPKQPHLGSLLLLLLQALPCFTVPSFNKHILKVTWTHVGKHFLHEVKNPYTMGQPEADPPPPLHFCPITLPAMLHQLPSPLPKLPSGFFPIKMKLEKPVFKCCLSPTRPNKQRQGLNLYG